MTINGLEVQRGVTRRMGGFIWEGAKLWEVRVAGRVLFHSERKRDAVAWAEAYDGRYGWGSDNATA